MQILENSMKLHLHCMIQTYGEDYASVVKIDWDVLCVGKKNSSLYVYGYIPSKTKLYHINGR